MNASNESASNDADLNLDVNWIIPADRIESVRRRALGGDNEAAGTLANHYRELRQGGEERRWLLVAANRGDCHSMSWLMWNSQEAGDRADAVHWNDALRQNACTLERAYGPQTQPNAPNGSAPMWNDQY